MDLRHEKGFGLVPPVRLFAGTVAILDFQENFLYLGKLCNFEDQSAFSVSERALNEIEN